MPNPKTSKAAWLPGAMPTLEDAAIRDLIADAALAEELFDPEELEEAAAQWRKDHE